MLKALDIQNGQYVISIDSEWETDVAPLRELCRKDLVVCPECRQPVHLRAGSVRIWHFAHRTDSNCPLKSESAVMLRAREMLYKLVRANFGDRVSLEDVIPGAPDSERADCVVSHDSGKIAYCIIEKQLRNRFDYMHIRQKAYEAVQWILLPQLFQKNPDCPEQFLLSATARDLASKDGINTMYAGSGNIGSLCCADAEHGQFLLARGLACVHEPNVFEPSAYMEVPSEHVIVSRKLGQLMVADEVSRFKEWQHALEVAEAQRRENEARAEEDRKRREKERRIQQQETKKRRDSIAAAINSHFQSDLEKSNHSEVRMLKCLRCHASFSEWEYMQYDGCVCKQCGAKERDHRLGLKTVPEERSGEEIQRDHPGKKELTCLHCQLKTRNWTSFSYTTDHPAGVCLCRACQAAGLAFPYEDLSQKL